MRSEQLSPRKILHRGVRPLPVVIVLIAAIAIVLIALLTRRHDPPPPLPQSESLMPASENARLSTPVGDLTLPQGLTETCLLADASKESQYEMRVYEMVGADKVLLFAISVGEVGNGYVLGSAPDASGKQTAIWLDIHEIKRADSWTADEYARVNRLQSHVNDLIDQINHLDGFQMFAK